MNSCSRPLQWLVWGILALVVAGITVLFVRQELSRQVHPKLPVIGEVHEFQLTNQFGVPVSLQDLRGKVWVADIIFTRCPGPCAMMTRHMSALQAELPKTDQLGFLSLTADPQFDQPPVLKKYGETFGADQTRWMFLTGPKVDLYRLAMAGLKLSVGENPDEGVKKMEDLFIHSTRFVVLDRAGRLRAYVDGADPKCREQLRPIVESLLAEK